MNFKRVMLAAPKSGSGKTVITCALLQALKDEGESVISYKCGPDYIDPMFHENVIGVPSKNLDTFFTDEEMTKRLMFINRKEEDFAVFEGVMGLFDGLGGVREEGSSYHLAKITKTPIILVIDAKGMGRSILPLIAGFLAYDEAKLIQGVILNRMSKGYYDIIKPLIEKELKISVLGYYPEKKKMLIESRHLGLIMPDELPYFKNQIREAAEDLLKTVSLDEIRKIAETAGDINFYMNVDNFQKQTLNTSEKPVIAVAKDEAFCFYYADNLRILKEYGAEIKFFSPVHDKELPKESDALLIGGGYPELYAKQLNENYQMRMSIKKAFDGGIPTVAECGGFMYLHTTIRDKEGKEWGMVDAISGTCANTGKLVRFGYIEIKESKNYFWTAGETIKGHEFHYYDSTNNGEGCLARKPVTGKEYSCIITGEHYWLGFPHLYYPSNTSFAKAFVEKAYEYKNKKELRDERTENKR